MSILWTPEKDRAERKEYRDEYARLLRIYRRNPKLRKLADEIHHARLIGGKACSQCIRMAMKKLGIERPKP